MGVEKEGERAVCTRGREKERKGKERAGWCKGSWRGAPSKLAFFFGFFLRGRLGVSFDHICILVMKFAPGPVISVYLTDSHSLRTGALIGRFKSGLRCRCCRCILLTGNIFDISALTLVAIRRETSQFPVRYIFSLKTPPSLPSSIADAIIKFV